MARPRFDGDAEQLYVVLEPFVISATWLHYVEKVNHAVKPSILIAHKAMIRACTSLAPNLSFTQTLVKEVFDRLQQTKAFPCLATPEQKEDWVETMTKRFRCACRHIMRERARKPPPRWLEHIDGAMAASSAGGDTGASGVLEASMH
jgi:hypothetical protein